VLLKVSVPQHGAAVPARPAEDARQDARLFIMD
jgi:hypothetical protein